MWTFDGAYVFLFTSSTNHPKLWFFLTTEIVLLKYVMVIIAMFSASCRESGYLSRFSAQAGQLRFILLLTPKNLRAAGFFHQKSLYTRTMCSNEVS